jgi:hypothetical protein
MVAMRYKNFNQFLLYTQRPRHKLGVSKATVWHPPYLWSETVAEKRLQKRETRSMLFITEAASYTSLAMPMEWLHSRTRQKVIESNKW